LIFSKFLGNKGVAIICTFGVSLTFFFAFYCFLDSGVNQSVLEIELFTWIADLFLLTKWNFIFDNLNLLILIMITGVSTLIHLYSLEYMSNDPHMGRFMIYLTLFTTAMLILICSENLIQLFLGWEAIGICSFLLINF
jgi:NADH:ubiquinone oxidoreductase subunit 5 (subunit L)/multisubunit Na+/H+ antiporter MnhA subunit